MVFFKTIRYREAEKGKKSHEQKPNHGRGFSAISLMHSSPLSAPHSRGVLDQIKRQEYALHEHDAVLQYSV
jgi:hypothetical protein